MKRILFVALLVIFFLPAAGYAQSDTKQTTRVFYGDTVPTDCAPAPARRRDVFIKTVSPGRGTYVCKTEGSYTFIGPLSGSATLDFDLTSTATQTLTITVTGAAGGDVVRLGVPNGAVTADTFYFAWVSATNTVSVRAIRVAGTPNPASGVFKVEVSSP
jgi:hypothetical protein